MNLFESQIEKLNISPSMKQSVIELRKVCLEGADDEHKLQEVRAMAETFVPGEDKNKLANEAMRKFLPTIKQAARELANEDDYDVSAPGAALVQKIKTKYLPMIVKEYGEESGNALMIAARQYADEHFLQ